ncbi:hypothetical protein HPB52_013802 [Rhipicephalus sanguineus]|uniref:Endonuclease/exonuclease/phosphatase domain-containing protein n=1 Tax=Rhipicephalus sanguineus TaxID=34632 RepID=A0A9D4YPM7_RHISA|nr:hypothetical protein HPB52_013802 [Rhipicephalus sanguineus]
MATATVVTGYDPTSMQVLTMETSSADHLMPSVNEYLEDMVNTWKRKKAKFKPASLPRDAATARRPTDAACTSAPSPPAKQPKWRPRQTPRLSRDDYIVVLKPRVPCELRTSVPAGRVGDAIRAYLGDQTTAQVQVWPIWDQNIIVCSTTELPKDQKLLGDFQLPVGDQQLPVRGHAKPSGETCRGVITINPAETSQKIKSELHWPQGTILAARKLGDSTAAVVTFEGTKLPRFLFYHCVATYVRPYKKTVPACTRCGTIGHRPSVCPHPNPDRCAKCGTLAAEGLTDHDCHPKCLLCQGAHETGARCCTGKYRTFTPTSTPSPGPTPSPLHNKGARPKQPGSPRPADTQEFPPLAASTAPPQESGPTPTLPGYCPYVGGTTTSLLVHKAYTAIQIDLDLHLPYDYCMVSVLPQRRGQPSIHILNVYCPPHLSRVSFTQLFHQALCTAARQPLVIVGDFNAPSPHWGYHYENTRGRQLKELISSLSLTLLTDPAHPTRSGNSVSRDTCPDLSLTRNIRDATWENLDETLGSDHFLLRIAFTPRQKMRHHWGQARLTDWTKLRSQPFPLIPNSGEYAAWASHALHTQRAHTQTLATTNVTPAIDPHLRHLWDARRGIIRRWRRNELNLVQDLRILMLHLLSSLDPQGTISSLRRTSEQVSRMIRRVSTKRGGLRGSQSLRLAQAFVTSRVLYAPPYLRLRRHHEHQLDTPPQHGPRTTLRSKARAHCCP